MAATNNLAPDTRIGLGSFSVVCGGILPDGRKVAIKALAELVYKCWVQMNPTIFLNPSLI
jgi:hypothetical protein